MTDTDDLFWCPWWGRRCKAHSGWQSSDGIGGRCDLREGHAGDHALDRGMDVPRWSTEWTG